MRPPSLFLLAAVFVLSAEGDGTACYNGCSGHGVCESYTCHCDTGFYGEDCGLRYVEGDRRVVGILQAGHYNLTALAFRKEVRATRKSGALLVVGFSALSCDKCVAVETEYDAAAPRLAALGVDFARVHIDGRSKQLAVDEGLTSLPAIKMYRKGVGHLFTAPHSSDAIVTHAEKLLGPPLPSFSTLGHLADAITSRITLFDGRPFTVALTTLGDSPADSDEYDDVVEAGVALHGVVDVVMGVAEGDLLLWMEGAKWFTRGSSLVLIRVGYSGSDADTAACMSVDDDGGASTGAECVLDVVASDRKTLNLPEFFDEGLALSEWIVRESVPPVAELTPANFAVYEAMQKPMLILFLDMRGFVGGHPLLSTSGEYSNERLLQEYADVARDKDFAGRIAFVYTDGIAHADRMKALGLTGGQANLPGLAFNVRDGRRLPFPVGAKLDVSAMRLFCSHFLEPRKGVYELFTAADAEIVRVVSASNFTRVVLDETKDVLLLLMARDTETSMAMTPYYRRVGLRFSELGLAARVTVARMDVNDGLPPVELSVDALPTLVLFPAFDKDPPYRYYSGVSKVGPIMQWVKQHSGLDWGLPELPQFNPEDKQLYKEQLTDREARRLERARAAGEPAQQRGGPGKTKKGKKKKKKKKVKK